MLYCALSYWRKSHFYLSKTTFPFYCWQKEKTVPTYLHCIMQLQHLKQRLPEETILGKQFLPSFQTCEGMQHLESEKTTVPSIIQIWGSPAWKSSLLGGQQTLEAQFKVSTGEVGRTKQSGFSSTGECDPRARLFPCHHSP